MHFLYRKRKHKYINGTKGVISLFLAILMLPFTMVVGSFINAARVNSALSIFDEALCNASNSTLGTYDSFLKSRFGLLALNQNVTGKPISVKGEDGTMHEYGVSDLINDTFEEYMKQNLKVLSNTYDDVDVDAKGVYSLADTNVLLYQIMEYSKYQVPLTLVKDAIDFDSLLKDLANAIPFTNIMGIFSKGLDIFDSVETIAESKDLLKTETTILEEKIYGEFSEDGSLKTDGMVQKHDKYVTVINDYQWLVNSYYVDEIASLRDVDIPNQEAIVDAAWTAYQNASADNKVALKAKYDEENATLTELRNDLTDKENERETKISEKSSEFETAKKEYSSSIGGVYSQLRTVNSKVTGVKDAYNSAASNVASITTEVITTIATNQTEKINEDINGLKKDIKDLQKGNTDGINEIAIQHKEWGLDLLDEQKTNVDNIKKVTNTVPESVSSVLAASKIDYKNNDASSSGYAKAATDLQTMQYNVDNYLLQDPPVAVDGNFLYISDIITTYGLYSTADLEEDDEAMIKNLAPKAILTFFKTLISFIDALSSISLIFEPKLAAKIDTEYYDANYGGLPSKKDRSSEAYALYYGESEDADNSNAYKDLLGAYEIDDADVDEAVSISETLRTIKNNIGTISDNIDDAFSVKVLLKFSEICKNIKNAIKNIFNALDKLIKGLANMFTKTGMGKKFLLSGYINYMCSNRTTYQKKAMNGVSFNKRNTQTSTQYSNVVIAGFETLLKVISNPDSVGTKTKCFVGAETEYIFAGTMSEIGNQSIVFGSMYIIRLVVDFVKLYQDPEISTIVALTGVFWPLTFLFFVLLEPLADVILLVNGGNVSLINNTIYLAPTNIVFYLSKLSKLGIKNAKLDSMANKVRSEANEFVKNSGEVPYDTVTGNNPTDSGVIDLNYSQYLLLLTTFCTSSDKMLARLSDIIEMEAVENAINTSGNSEAKFDLDNSYMAIRAEGTFNTSEFIHVSDGDGIIKMKNKRTIYKSY